jgi:hypothetical protein
MIGEPRLTPSPGSALISDARHRDDAEGVEQRQVFPRRQARRR